MTHKITRIALIAPDGIDWECECGVTGRCPRPIAAMILAEHLADFGAVRHAGHDPSLICRPAGSGLCEVLR
jgi:hypothetical protein